MGRRGPAPQPTALRILKGNPSGRPLPKNEPKPEVGIPDCPPWLDTIARAEWRRVAPELERLGLLTIIDGTALAGYCAAYSQWRSATLALREYGLTIERPDGSIASRPEVGIALKSLGMVRAFCQEFGLTPSARARMSIGADTDQADPFEAFLTRGHGDA